MEAKYESRYTKILEATLRKYEVPWNKVNNSQFEYHGKRFTVAPHRFGLCEHNSENLKKALDDLIEVYREPHAALFLYRFYFAVDFNDRNTEYGQFTVDHLMLDFGELPLRPKSEITEEDEERPRDMHFSQPTAAPVTIPKPAPTAPKPLVEPYTPKTTAAVPPKPTDMKSPEPEIKYHPEQMPRFHLDDGIHPEPPSQASSTPPTSASLSQPKAQVTASPITPATPTPASGANSTSRSTRPSLPSLTEKADAPLPKPATPTPKSTHTSYSLNLPKPELLSSTPASTPASAPVPETPARTASSAQLEKPKTTPTTMKTSVTKIPGDASVPVKKEESVDSPKTDATDFEGMQKDIAYLLQMLGKDLNPEIVETLAQSIVVIVKNHPTSDSTTLQKDIAQMIQLLGRSLPAEVVEVLSKSILIVVNNAHPA